jgi:tRNA A-37 threonylcarbamoyl transferase component Bud32
MTHLTTTSHERTSPGQSARKQERLFEAPAWQWARAGDTGWWVRSDWNGELLTDGGLKLDEWREQGMLRVVKTGPHRTVYRVDLPKGSIFVKHFLVPDLRSIARQWFRRGKGRNEGCRAVKLAAIGVDTIQAIALGEQRKHSFLFENYLITQAIPQTIPLDEFVESYLPRMDLKRQAKVRQALAVAIGELTAHLHDAGFVHKDFHPGNLLVRFDSSDCPHLSLIDLDALRVTRCLSWKDARTNLALLNHYFWLRSTRADRTRFLQTYLKARHADAESSRWFATNIETSTRQWAERLWLRWGKRCRGSNKYFKRFQAKQAWAIASRDLDREVAKQAVENPMSLLSQPDTVILKESRTTTVAEVTLNVDNIPTRVIFKRFKSKKTFEWLLNILRPTRAWRAWQAAQHFVSRGIPTPQNLVIIERTTPLLPIPLETYLITTKAESAQTLSDYIIDTMVGLGPEDQRKAIHSITKGLAALLRVMHERSISDRDLKAANIMLQGDPVTEQPRLSLIDLVGVQLCHPLPEHRREQNLARLQLSLESVPGRTRTDSLRFLRSYLAWGLSPHNDWKSFWRAVERVCDKKRERNRNRGRILS